MANTKPKKQPENDEIVDLDLSVTRKKRFRIDGDNDRILELNTSDVGILTRMEKTYPKLDEEANKAFSISTQDDELTPEQLDDLASAVVSVDKQMREYLDFIFDSNVSEICAPTGTMYDPFNGVLRYEHIINALLPLYEDNIANEAKKMRARMESHTDKYTKKK